MADISRIKGNIAKMIAQNAPETDIDAYVASEGITLDELRKPPAAAPDKYQRAAIEERDTLKAKGIDTGAGLTRRLAQGATFNLADEILAGATTPLEMIKRGTFNPREGYNYAKAREDLIIKDARENPTVFGADLSPYIGKALPSAIGAATEIGGGVGSGLGAARAGLSFARGLVPEAGLAARSLASAGDAAAFGSLAGAGEGNSLAERLKGGLVGGAVGGLLGGATPAALSLLGAAASPIVSNIRARINPEGFARSQVARGVSESGMTPAQIADEVRTAANEGQGMFTAADAMGNAGQRMLSSTARAPGQARTDVVNFLDNRQAGQGRRVAGSLSEGFNSRMTPDQLRGAMTAERGAIADEAYGAVRSDARPVNVNNVLAQIDANVPTAPAAPDTISGRLQRYRNMLAGEDGNLTNFEQVQRVRSELSDDIQTAVRGGQGNRARLLGQTLRELDTSLENASEGFRQANRDFAGATRNIEAIDQGRTAALRGRTEDTIPAFQALGPRGQQAYRTGYADPLISNAQSAAFGANKARPLINDAFADEAAVMAPGNALMQRRIGRENTMFQTRNAATGNSKTAENLADDAAMGIDPTLIGQVLSGNWSGALRSVIASGSNALSGNTPAVRQAVADMLMTRGGNVNAAQFQRMIDETIQRIQRVQQMARSFGRGAAGGLAVATPSQNRR